VQLNLDILEDLPPDTRVWESLNDEHIAILIESLARLIVKAVVTRPNGANHDREH
jgi:hypothetical protein